MQNNGQPLPDSRGKRSDDQRKAPIGKLVAPATFAIFAACVLGLGVVLHFKARNADYATAEASLSATTRLSALALNTWVTERQADAQVVGSSPFLSLALSHLSRKSSGETESEDLVQEQVDNLRRNYDYAAIALVDAQGKVRFAQGRQLSTSQIDALLNRRVDTEAQWVELPTQEPTELRLGLLRTVSSRERTTPWKLYLEIRPEWLVNTLHLAQPANWKGEVLLVHSEKIGRRVLAAGWTAQLQDFAQTHMVRGGKLQAVVEAALSPAARRLDGVNRRGERVLSSSEDITLPGWTLVASVTEEAVFQGLHARTRLLVAAMSALLFLGALAVVAWRRGDRHKARARETGLRQHYEAILRNSKELFMLTDEHGTILDVSHSAAATYGVPRERLIGMSVQAFRADSPAADGQLPFGSDLQPGESKDFQDKRVKANGEHFLLEGTLGRLDVDESQYVVTIGRDVTTQRAMETHQRVSTSFFNRSHAGIIISNAEKRIVQINAAVTEITGYEEAELLGQRTAILNAGLEPEVLARARDCIQREGHWEGELRGRRKDGTVFPARLLVNAYADDQGRVLEFVDIFTDLTRLKRAERQAEYLAHHDRLTELPNRAMLERQLPELIEQLNSSSKTPASLTVALINLDRFTSINESFGHGQGDALLMEVARRLRAISPDSRTLYRYGGDEFVLVMTGNMVTHALLVSNVRTLLTPPVFIDGHPVSATASIGIASYPEQARSADELMRNVESAMRIAKANGRNTWRVYEPEMNATAFEDMLLAVELRQALDAGDLQLHLQAQYSLEDGTMVGAEALLRWPHVTRGNVPPSRFIPIAESSGLIAEVGKWVLQEAARIWAGWRAQGFRPIPIAINLSAVQFQSPDFVAEVLRVIDEFDLPGGALEMELTESIIMEDSDEAIGRMFKLVDMGIQLAIDDFGTGYSSLSYLRRIPVRKLKIDRSFVLELGAEGGNAGEAIAGAVIAMAKRLQLRVIAEGVETQAQCDFLRASGCDEVQGYLFARPAPVVEVTALLQRNDSVS